MIFCGGGIYLMTVYNSSCRNLIENKPLQRFKKYQPAYPFYRKYTWVFIRNGIASQSASVHMPRSSSQLFNLCSCCQFHQMS
mmetsp:Transcript_4520/g.6183  ORF Transcript_4520/g.6183 Transcript_4520/m.6183 type:complete len:82 (-) Transcript_4520:1015-1260(-)